ncbi:UNVERIFIED_CONTAM: hypothetical protein H355_016488 [Colinus virginianus]|nr:hypothetical protein H355_016488 [Colinus virginianus]
MEDPIQLKEEGNKYFQASDYERAAQSYTQAMKLNKDRALQAVLYRNRAACFLKKLRIQFSTDMRVQKMFEILLDENSEKEKREKAANNLIVLGREEAGAERIFQNNGVSLLLQLIETKNAELVLAAVRTLSGMCTGHKARATAILHYLGIDSICMWMSVDNEEISLAVCNLLQTITDCLLGQGKEEHHGKEEALVLDTKKDLKMITTRLLDMLVSKNVSGQGRDRALNLLNKNIPRQDLKDHDNSRTTFVIDNGLKKILKVVGQIPEMPGCLPLTENTQLTASILLNKLYDDLRCDPERDNYRMICEEYIKSKIDPQNMDKTLHAIQMVSGVLQGPFELGNKLLGMKGVMEMMVALCGSEREIDQLVAVEALIHASTKLSRATFIISNGITLLKEIYKKTKNEKIKIRALVGLCKLGSAGGTDYGLRQFAEGSTEKLAKQCRKWLCNTSIDARTRKWAVEGLAYLTLDADVKDDFVEDEQALQAMFELAKDKKDFVVKRVKRLLKAGVVSALACMVKADSAILTDQSKELIARVFLALCEDPKDRGTIVAQGGGKALIPLAVEGTDVGKIKASHALAKIAAISNPDIAFPGERVQERFVADGNDRLKLVVLLCGEDDEKVQKAAAGALAMLTAAQKKLCSKMTEVTTQWLEILQRLCLHDNMEVQHRGLVIAFNLISANKELAKKLVETELLEILTFVGKQEDDPKKQHVINVARDCLAKCMDYGLIKPLSRA